MKKMKISLAFLALSLIALLSISSVKATLDISVNVENPVIDQGETQLITATTNEPGVGLLIVLQPALGGPWTDFLMTHPELMTLLASLPPEIQAQLQGLIGDKIVSYKLIGPIPEDAPIQYPLCIPAIFPCEFTGINGEPSTELVGDYKVIFVFLSCVEEEDGQVLPDAEPTDAVETTQLPIEVSLIELDFACGRWFVVPEVALGTIAPILASMAALPIVKMYKRKHA
jgi:hypothetical protein